MPCRPAGGHSGHSGRLSGGDFGSGGTVGCPITEGLPIWIPLRPCLPCPWQGSFLTLPCRGWVFVRGCWVVVAGASDADWLTCQSVVYHHQCLTAVRMNNGFNVKVHWVRWKAIYKFQPFVMTVTKFHPKTQDWRWSSTRSSSLVLTCASLGSHIITWDYYLYIFVIIIHWTLTSWMSMNLWTQI